MKTNRLQLILIPELCPGAQPLPPDVRSESIELIAMMLLGLVHAEQASDEKTEVRDERLIALVGLVQKVPHREHDASEVVRHDGPDADAQAVAAAQCWRREGRVAPTDLDQRFTAGLRLRRRVSGI